MFDLESVLRTPLPEPYVRIKSSSASQADIMHGKHPSAVRVWDNFQGVVQTHVGNMKSTKKRFVQSSSATDQVCPSPCHVRILCLQCNGYNLLTMP